MLKIQVTIVAVVMSASFLKIKSQGDELARQDRMISKLWSDKISDYQYLINTTYRDLPTIEGFIGDLDKSIDILRKLSYHSELTTVDKSQVLGFITEGLISFLGTEESEICERLQVDSLGQIFQGEDFEVVERLERVINPRIMTRCREYQPFDIYEKRTEWSFEEGDTVKLMIRLLSNYSLRSHVAELVAQKNLNLIDPYWGEFTYVASEESVRLGRHQVFFNTYDWISRDTVENSVVLMSGQE
ncbi:MAG: hypothetical protein AB8F78_15500 [Saprospiraceae bacterium]